MIKFIFAAVWLCAATVGAVVYSYQTSQARQNAAPAPTFFGGMSTLKTGIISVPVLQDGKVGGYFLARLSYTADPDILSGLTIPPETLLTDQIYTYLFANPQIDWADKKSIDLEAFKKGIREAVNKKIGKDLIHDVLIEQVDYLSKSEIRDNALRRRLGPEEEEAKEPAKKEH
jgi:hypothetical protein